ncbi:MAG TPA: hypothetical protein VFW50_37480 [Streptosporangiaceae bacterium]|nr:hypothetical protein [Streptosporangiaceae bacterium]
MSTLRASVTLPSSVTVEQDEPRTRRLSVGRCARRAGRRGPGGRGEEPGGLPGRGGRPPRRGWSSGGA